MKLCKDCEHYLCTIFIPSSCKLGTKRVRSNITGKVEVTYASCTIGRSAACTCGPEAKLFVPKRKWWRFGL